jgi:succinyl-CoA synthetase beta subunit
VKLPNRPLSEFESKEILRSIGLSVPAGALAHSSDEASEIAHQIGFPVVIKAQSPELLHKTEAGGVVLNLKNLDELADGWRTLQENLRHYRPELKLDGVLVEKMADGGAEFLVGAKNDPDWGPTLFVGLGGIFVEVLHTVRILPPHLSKSEIVDEIRELEAKSILDGFRGAPPPDLSAIAEILQRIGQFVASHPEIREVDLNPVIAHAKGATILDTCIICS